MTSRWNCSETTLTLLFLPCTDAKGALARKHACARRRLRWLWHGRVQQEAKKRGSLNLISAKSRCVGVGFLSPHRVHPSRWSQQQLEDNPVNICVCRHKLRSLGNEHAYFDKLPLSSQREPHFWRLQYNTDLVSYIFIQSNCINY